MSPYFAQDLSKKKSRALRVVRIEPPAEKEDPDLPEEPEPDMDGQIVEIAPPEVQEKPEESDYLAEYDQTVEEETRTERFEVNPEVLAKVWSEEAKMETEDLVDLNVDKPSTGAQVGNHRFDPSRDGALASLPSYTQLVFTWMSSASRQRSRSSRPSIRSVADSLGQPSIDPYAR